MTAGAAHRPFTLRMVGAEYRGSPAANVALPGYSTDIPSDTHRSAIRPASTR